MEDTMENTAVEALAGLLNELRRADADELSPEAAAVRVYPAFRAAVAQALTEMREGELEGLARWRAARHAPE